MKKQIHKENKHDWYAITSTLFPRNLQVHIYPGPKRRP